jgi:hypothetical protein
VVVGVEISCTSRFGHKKSNEEAPFSINEPGKVSQVGLLIHKTPLYLGLSSFKPNKHKNPG